MNSQQLREWGLLLKARFRDGSAPERERLEAVLAALPGPDRKLTTGTADFTVSWWIEAPDAARAVSKGGETLRELCRRQGLPEVEVIRSHAASVEGRFPAWQRGEAYLGTLRTWAVDVKVSAPVGDPHPPAGQELLQQVHAGLGLPDSSATLRGDPEKFLLDDGSGFTLRFWIAGDSPAAAYRAARDSVLTALAATGLEDWTIVRFKARTPQHNHGDTFPGAAKRTPRITEETR